MLCQKLIDTWTKCIAELHDEEETTLTVLELDTAAGKKIAGVDFYISVFAKTINSSYLFHMIAILVLVI